MRFIQCLTWPPDLLHLEQTALKTFDDHTEACIGELITTDFLPALLNNKLFQQRALEITVEEAVNRQLHVTLAPPAVIHTLSLVIADLTRKRDSFDFFASIMAKIRTLHASSPPC